MGWIKFRLIYVVVQHTRYLNYMECCIRALKIVVGGKGGHSIRLQYYARF
jgi:hypothetical protein